MVNNLGLTLTPDSMVSFRDAAWPMLVMSFLAYAGNTCYPILLRLFIWIMYRLTPTGRAAKRPLLYLLDHPRRCYTLLFPWNVTFILGLILLALNFLDALFIVILDLNNQEVAALPPGPRVLAAIFQAASSRHTGTATFNLAKVNPAVQFSLLVMMYVSVFPVAMSMRVSNDYDNGNVGKYHFTEVDDTLPPWAYLASHLRNQLGFDLWYIFLGTFCICIAEAAPIADSTNLAFNVFAILFEVVSAYGNVGLSLGTNATLTSLSGDFTVFSKLVICLMMLRGRHRGLPNTVDRAVRLPEEDLYDEMETS
jgi:potassium uptake Trk family protein